MRYVETTMQLYQYQPGEPHFRHLFDAFLRVRFTTNYLNKRKFSALVFSFIQLRRKK